MPQLLGNSSSHEEAAVPYATGSIVSIVVFIVVFMIGVPGNGLVIWVAGLKMKRSVNIIWILNLAVADFMCCLSLPLSVVHLALHEHWPYGWFLCKVIPSVIIFTMFASVFILVAISIDRCLLVMKPVWCQNHRTVKFVSLLLLDYLNDSVNDLLAYDGNDSWVNFYESDYSVPFAVTVINITRAALGFVLPFGIMAFCYALIALRMRADRFHKPRNRMLQTITLVVAAFFICWAPYHVVGILFLVPRLRESLSLWDHLSIAFAYANSCINPLLYVFVGRDFRAKARQSLQGILEGAFTEEPTRSIPCSLDRSKTSTEKDVSSTV
uniref:Complement C3a receptor 1 n=1 Tax=Calidris pygmaea TaxID=425635 RepID=A0A8C3JNM2_9CHAR